MKKDRVVLQIITVIMGAFLLASCSEKAQIPHRLLGVKESKSTDSTAIDVSVAVPLGTADADIERLLKKLLSDYAPKTFIDKSSITVTAYGDNASQSELGKMSQYYGGRIAFVCAGKTTYDRPIESPVLSREERERQQEVGKFAGELIDAGKKIQNR